MGFENFFSKKTPDAQEAANQQMHPDDAEKIKKVMEQVSEEEEDRDTAEVIDFPTDNKRFSGDEDINRHPVPGDDERVVQIKKDYDPHNLNKAA